VARGERNVRVIDLVHELPRAERRPLSVPFEVAEHTLSSVRRATIVAPVPSRIVWTLRLPARGMIHTWVALLPSGGSTEATVTLRFGISDDRRYDPLARHILSAKANMENGWTALAADLSLYGGPQWSVFHRPDARPWRLVFSADAGHGDARVLWGAPGVDTDQEGARSWWQKRGARTGS
jgi:hypothetical protein